MTRLLLRHLRPLYNAHANSLAAGGSARAGLSTMKAAIVHHHKDKFSIEERAVPEPGPDQVLVRLKRSGVCHTDVHAVEGDWPVKSKLPLIPGHEGAGVVEKVGSAVKHIKVGDRVGVPWLHSACGTCEFCLSGWETLCKRQQTSGYSVDGCFSTHVLAAAGYVARLPDGLSFEQAAPILCAGVTTYKGLKMTEARPGQSVTILGAGGGLGHLAVQYAKAMGLVVVAVDVGQGKLDFCTSLGADVAVDALDKEAVKKVQTATGGGSHGVLCLATNPNAFRQAISLCRSNGTIVCVGLPPGEFGTPIFETVLRGLTIRGSIVGTRQDMSEALAFAAAGKVKCMVESAKLHDIQEVYDRVKHGKVNGRIVLNLEDEGKA